MKELKLLLVNVWIVFFKLIKLCFMIYFKIMYWLVIYGILYIVGKLYLDSYM